MVIWFRYELLRAVVLAVYHTNFFFDITLCKSDTYVQKLRFFGVLYGFRITPLKRNFLES